MQILGGILLIQIFLPKRLDGTGPKTFIFISLHNNKVTGQCDAQRNTGLLH